MAKLPAETLGTYRLIAQTAAGGMAIIYKAYDEALDRFVAIKILPDYLSRDTAFSERFRAEARNVARLRHPNILPIYGYGEQDGLHYFVMDLVEGGTLKDRMRVPMALADVVALIAPVADALQYAHEQGVVHRDVKPSNILLFRQDWPLLSDFGIARVLEQTSQLTHTGSAFFGTPHYMAPEQARGETVSPATDQYALGIVVYEMLTGVTPYRADTPQAVVYQHIYAELPLPSRQNADITPAVEQVVVRALAKAPEDRFPDMRSFAAALRAAAGDEPGAVYLAPAALPSGDANTFPPEHAAPAFRPAQPTPAATDTGPGTERLARPATAVANPPAPTETAVIAETSSVPARLRFTPRMLAAGAAGLLLVAALIGFVVLHGASGSTAGSGAPVSLTLKAPSSAPANFRLLDAGHRQVRMLHLTSASATLSLLPGQYTLRPTADSTYLDPLLIDVPSGTPSVVDLTRRYGRLIILPPAGRITVPDLDLRAPGPLLKLLHPLSAAQAIAGVYLRPREYAATFYRDEYAVPVLFRTVAGRNTTVDLSRRLGRLTVIPLRGTRASGFDMTRQETGRLLTSISAPVGRDGFFVPAGRYSINFYASEVYVDSLTVTVLAGKERRLDLNTLFATLVSPGASPYTLQYRWREGSALRSFVANTTPTRFYLHAGTYRFEIQRGAKTRVIRVHAPPGSLGFLPAH